MKQETTVFTHYDNPLKVESVREPESHIRLKIATQLLARYKYNTVWKDYEQDAAIDNVLKLAQKLIDKNSEYDNK